MRRDMPINCLPQYKIRNKNEGWLTLMEINLWPKNRITVLAYLTQKIKKYDISFSCTPFFIKSQNSGDYRKESKVSLALEL